jgi:hypothetical protein
MLLKADGKKRQIDDDVKYVIKANEIEKKESSGRQEKKEDLRRY